MPQNLRLLRRKIRTTENIRQITRAMSMVSGVQLRRVQSRVEQSHEYFQQLTGILERVAAGDVPMEHPYLRAAEQPRRVGLVMVAGDRGLCGGYNAGVLRLAEQFVGDMACQVQVLPVGAKAVAYARRKGWLVLESFPLLRDVERPERASQTARAIRSHFDEGGLDSLHMIYTRFASTSRHVPTTEQILPISGEIDRADSGVEYIYEPDAPQFIGTLLPMATEARLRYNLLQSLASEHAARMIAMTASADNAEQVGDGLVRDLNRARQQKITSEVLEVVSGAEALG